MIPAAKASTQVASFCVLLLHHHRVHVLDARLFIHVLELLTVKRRVEVEDSLRRKPRQLVDYLGTRAGQGGSHLGVNAWLALLRIFEPRDVFLEIIFRRCCTNRVSESILMILGIVVQGAARTAHLPVGELDLVLEGVVAEGGNALLHVFSLFWRIFTTLASL